MEHHELEEGTTLFLDFGKLKKVVACGEDLLPAVAQHADTGEVLIVGYANQLALETALATQNPEPSETPEASG